MNGLGLTNQGRLFRREKKVQRFAEHCWYIGKAKEGG
jgi:hypothetical protein